MSLLMIIAAMLLANSRSVDCKLIIKIIIIMYGYHDDDYYYVAIVQLTSDILSSNGFICLLVTFNCTAVDFPSEILRWQFNNDLVGAYPFESNTAYPFDVTSTRPDVIMIQILQASINQNLFSYSSTLTANSSIFIQEDVSMTCGSLTLRSDAITIEMSQIRGELECYIALMYVYYNIRSTSISFRHMFFYFWSSGLPPVVPLLHLSTCCGEVSCGSH